MPKPNHRTICTAQYASGNFCQSRSIPGAPFPICIHHAALIMEFLDAAMPRDLDDRIIVAWRAMEQRQEVRQRKPEPCGVVYYIQVGPHIKIGHTENLTGRLGAYPPDSRLLATEPGTRALEAQRHREFTDALRQRREWFAPTPELLAHIERLRRSVA